MAYLPSNVPPFDPDNPSSALGACSQCANLRFNCWKDRHHLPGRNRGGLHSNNIDFVKEIAQEAKKVEAFLLARKAKLPKLGCQLFLDDSLNDVLDALVCLDRLDGGFSFFVRTSGLSKESEDPMKVDCYAPPCELKDPSVQEEVDLMVRFFIEHIAIRHHQELAERYLLSGIKRPNLLTPVDVDKPQLPFSVTLGSCHYQLLHEPTYDESFYDSVEISSASKFPSKTVATSLEVIKTRDEITPFEVCGIGNATNTPRRVIQGELEPSQYLAFQFPKEETHHSAIISIGPNTDAIMDTLKISDQIIPHLRFLVRSVRSTHWADELQKEGLGFSAKAAEKLSRALLKDLSPKLNQHRASNAVDRITLLITLLTFALLLMLSLA